MRGTIVMSQQLNFSEVRDIILGELLPYFDKAGIDPSSFDNDHDLLKSGLMDSLDFLDLVESIEENNGLTFDFTNVKEPDISRLECFLDEIIRQNNGSS